MGNSTQHNAWIKAGGPAHLAIPLRNLRDVLTSYGYTVYWLGDDGHLNHQPPEDHTPYSATGWPVITPYGWVTAIDIMPPAASSGLPSLQQLGAQILADRKVNHLEVAWLKYMNWEPDGDYIGPCWQERFMPTHNQRASTDRGHIHISARSDMTGLVTTYDPVARLRHKGADDMAFMDDVNAAAVAWRVEGLVNGRDTVADGPTKGEPIVINRKLTELAKMVGAPARLDVNVDAAVLDTLLAELRTVVREEVAARFADAGQVDATKPGT